MSGLCRLVPYTKDLVPVYHGWFQKYPELLGLTASEPLSLQEELENQQTWLEDPNKVTFIILDTSRNNDPCGDVNCFVNEDTGELNVMIADPQSRRKGIAKTAVQAMMQTVRTAFPQVKRFIAKIDRDNTPSRKMFESLDFIAVREVDIFNEVHYEKAI